MKIWFACIRIALMALAVAAVALAANPAFAQQRNSDGSVNPTASAVKEDQLLKALGATGHISGRVSIPDQKSGTLIQPEGQRWRHFHQVRRCAWIGVIAIVGMLGILVLFYLFRGMVRLETGTVRKDDRTLQ